MSILCGVLDFGFVFFFSSLVFIIYIAQPMRMTSIESGVKCLKIIISKETRRQIDIHGIQSNEKSIRCRRWVWTSEYMNEKWSKTKKKLSHKFQNGKKFAHKLKFMQNNYITVHLDHFWLFGYSIKAYTNLSTKNQRKPKKKAKKRKYQNTSNRSHSVYIVCIIL